MKVRLFGLGVLLAGLVLGGLATSRARADDPKTEEGFVPLFNGKDLTGWKTHPDDKARWRVDGGNLIGEGPAGHLFSVRGDYKNFIYRIEAKINDKGNSGQYFRTKFAKAFPPGYEAQINSTHPDPQRTGSLYNIAKITDMLVPPDEWFTQEVIARGDHIIIKVNGKKVVDVHDGKYAMGHFAIQQHNEGSVVTVRKIEVKELPDDAK